MLLSMDRDLLRQSVAFHGQSLFSLLKCEQSENPDFEHVTADLAKSVNQRYKLRFSFQFDGFHFRRDFIKVSCSVKMY